MEMPVRRRLGLKSILVASVVLIVCPLSFIGRTSYERLTNGAAASLYAQEIPPAPPPESFILTRTSVAIVNGDGDFEQVAQCEAGEQLLGGGYYMGDLQAYQLSVRANHPTGESAWRVVFHNQSQRNIDVPVAAYAYCFHAPNFLLGLVTVAADNQSQSGVEQTIVASCPSGSVLTGGGFAINAPSSDTDGTQNADVITSRPDITTDGTATGWRVALRLLRADLKRPTQSFARCATQRVRAQKAAVLSKNLVNSVAAAQEYNLTTDCPDGGISTGGGHEYHGDFLVPHPVFSVRASPNLRTWTTRFFGAWQTTNYSFRPCDPSIADCLSGLVVAACFEPPDIPFIYVRISSPANGAHFDLAQPGTAATGPVTFSVEVVDKSGNPLPRATVRWRLTNALGSTPLGAGLSFSKTLPAGATITDMRISATATWGKLSASDAIKVSTGTVP
jgi:hypothetical protein